MRKNIKTNRSSHKLDVKRLNSFKILEVIDESKMIFKLELPSRIQIHSIFHVSLLESYKLNTLPGRTQSTPPSILVENELEYVVNQVLNSKIDRGKLKYYIDWEGYPPEDRTWEPATYLKNAKEAVDQFHSRHPNRPSPADLSHRDRSSSSEAKGRAGARPRKGGCTVTNRPRALVQTNACTVTNRPRALVQTNAWIVTNRPGSLV